MDNNTACEHGTFRMKNHGSGVWRHDVTHTHTHNTDTGVRGCESVAVWATSALIGALEVSSTVMRPPPSTRGAASARMRHGPRVMADTHGAHTRRTCAHPLVHTTSFSRRVRIPASTQARRHTPTCALARVYAIADGRGMLPTCLRSRQVGGAPRNMGEVRRR